MEKVCRTCFYRDRMTQGLYEGFAYCDNNELCKKLSIPDEYDVSDIQFSEDFGCIFWKKGVNRDVRV